MIIKKYMQGKTLQIQWYSVLVSQTNYSYEPVLLMNHFFTKKKRLFISLNESAKMSFEWISHVQSCSTQEMFCWLEDSVT